MSYGYNKYSSTMSSRGRGFVSRGGSYRGRGGGGGNEWSGGSAGGTMSGRGGYSSSRGGRFKYSTTSYDSRSKYNSGGSERYSSRGGRGEHSNSYKRPREYSARDDHRSSSDSARKRIRSDSYQGGGSGSGSQRYSSYGGSSASAPYDDNKGSSSSAVYEDKRQSERASSYHRSEDRHSASRSYAPPPPPRISEMAPPPTQRYTSSRGRISHQSSNYRGRISTRGSSGRGGAFHRVSSRSDGIIARKRTLHSLDYRRKLLGTRSRDYIQRMRMTTTKLRRSTTRLPGSKKDSGSGTSVKDKDREMAKAINAEFSDDEDEEDDNKSNWDEEEKPHDRDDEEEEIEEEEEKKKKEDKRKKEKQDRERQHSEDEEEKDDDIKEEDDEQKREEDEEGDDEERREDEKAEHDRNADSEELPSRRDGRKFIKLRCPHCAHHSVTFKEYSLHLFSGRHSAAMKRIASRHKATITRMRVVQRQEQRRIEARDAARGTLPSRTMFCAICKLNYRSLKAAHQLSESHKQIKRFLTPFCRVCRIQFRSPMFFETHMCSLEHIKRKSVMRERMNANGSGEAEADSSAPEEDDKEVNLDNFMTLDSVGDVDEDEESNDKKKEKTDGESPNETEKKAKSKQMIKVGAEYIKRVEVQYCELCKVYLSRSENMERAVALHCSTRSHLKRYVRDNDDKALRRQAERIHLQSSSSANMNSTNSTAVNTSETAKSSPMNVEAQVSTNTASTTVTNDNNGASDAEYIKLEEEKSNLESEKSLTKDGKDNQGDEDDDNDYHGDDKMTWDDVDKDLGDILRENEAAASKSSDDEDSRYDRFRNSDKKQQSGKEKETDKNEIVEDKGGNSNNKLKEVKVKLEKAADI
ncbi:DNA ligase 1 isoform X2 [Ooceraea biroi]|uniref:Zinc finger protein on ecdysone puffs n=1 Tax=Ooceraea biroi TaxID=2015173 RepID=A0A026VVI4_OOCBI|nr:DNA ligase 1 isoform X2 [Ooceraea biroi]EZA46844.1 hypothetical protein X777_01138 [Ooceraea biroi]